MRRKHTIYNTITALILQAVTILIGFILPRLIITEYGSDVNGLLNSITQFLGYIALLEGGIGAVIKAVLYKVLAKKDKHELSVVVVSMQKYFRHICVGLVIYVVALCIIYPNFVAAEFDVFFTISLLLVVAISSFVQYFFGIANQILLQADQHGYIVNISRIITQIISTGIMIALILNGADIRIVKGIGVSILALSPLSYYLYVKKHYRIDYSVKADKHVLAQRHDGFAHQISAFIHTNTDIVLLTLFGNMSGISVYSVYAMVTSGLKSILSTFSGGINASLGNLYGNGENDKLGKHFRIFNYFYLLMVVFAFTIAGVLITPFVQLYTSGVTDADYFQPIFGVLLVLAEAIYCIRCSYSNLIFLVGDFKPTKMHGYIEAIINILLSLALIKPLGLVGIAIGTLSGMTYRWIVSMIYVHKHIMKLDVRNILKKYAVNIASILVFIWIIFNIINPSSISSVQDWIADAMISSLLMCAIMLFANIVFCRKDFTEMFNEYIGKFLQKFRRKTP